MQCLASLRAGAAVLPLPARLLQQEFRLLGVVGGRRADVEVGPQAPWDRAVGGAALAVQRHGEQAVPVERQAQRLPDLPVLKHRPLPVQVDEREAVGRQLRPLEPSVLLNGGPVLFAQAGPEESAVEFTAAQGRHELCVVPVEP